MRGTSRPGPPPDGDLALAGREGGEHSSPDPERAELRARSAQASRAVLHTLAWVLGIYFASDYLPPLAVRQLAPAGSGGLRIYLTGYLVLAAICVVLGTAFARVYRPAIARSRYPQRWLVFPVLLAVLLIPSQGWNEWLTRGVEAGALVLGLGAGLRSRSRWRSRSRSQG